jgi:endonuclease/exonuclease/phosphatase family metal-dependent hydrolase
MAIKLLTLSIENDRHLDRVCAEFREHLPDVVCLQEALESDCARLASPGGHKCLISNIGRLPGPSGEERNCGAAVLSRPPVRFQPSSTTPTIRAFEWCASRMTVVVSW